MKKGGLIDETGDEMEESTGNGVETDIVAAVVLTKEVLMEEEMGKDEREDVTDATLEGITETAVGEADDDAVVATVGRVNVEEVEETGNGSTESKS